MGQVGTGAIPETTTPMVKFVRTGEGMLVVAFNIALLVVPIISSALTPAQAVKWAAVINGVAVVARTGLKMTSLVQAGAVAAPEAAIAASPEEPEEATSAAPILDGTATVPIDADADVTAAAPIDATHIDDLVSDSDEFASLPSVTNINNNMTPVGAA
jgi:hypothetical protein